MRRPRLPAFALLLLAGCYAQHTSFRPTKEERKALEEPPLPYSVAVRHWQRPTFQNPRAYATNAAKLLASSGAFARVTYDSTGTTAADLVAESTTDYCNTAIIPMLTIITLGIFPTVWKETECSGVVFRSPHPGNADSVVVRVRQSGTAIMGWVATPFALFPGWSWHGMRYTSAYHKQFRLAVLEQRAELGRLAGH